MDTTKYTVNAKNSVKQLLNQECFLIQGEHFNVEIKHTYRDLSKDIENLSGQTRRRCTGMTFELHLEQDTGYYGCLAKERPDKVENITAKNKMEARHIAVDKLYKSNEKYIYATVFDNDSNMIIHITRC